MNIPTNLYHDKALEKMVADYNFRLSEEGDHTLMLEHLPCGHKDKLSQTGATPESILKTIKSHIKICPKYNEGVKP